MGKEKGGKKSPDDWKLIILKKINEHPNLTTRELKQAVNGAYPTFDNALSFLVDWGIVIRVIEKQGIQNDVYRYFISSSGKEVLGRLGIVSNPDALKGPNDISEEEIREMIDYIQVLKKLNVFKNRYATDDCFGDMHFLLTSTTNEKNIYSKRLLLRVCR